MKTDTNWNILWVKSAWWTGWDIWQWIVVNWGNIYIGWWFSSAADMFWNEVVSSWWNDWFITRIPNE